MRKLSFISKTWIKWDWLMKTSCLIKLPEDQVLLDEKEIFTVKHNFLIKKLGLEDGEYLDKAIVKVAEMMGITNRVKYRAIFYYLLVKELGQESKILS